MSRDTVGRCLGTSLHFGLLVEDYFGVWVSPICDGGIVLATVKADALAGGLGPALSVAAGAAGGRRSGAAAGGRRGVPLGGPGGRPRGTLTPSRPSCTSSATRPSPGLAVKTAH